MTGIEDLNRAAFEKAEADLWDQSVGPTKIINPHELAKRFSWSESTELPTIASVLIDELTQCHAIYMLRGWESSKGARAEHAVAVWLGLEIIYQGGEG
jgi:hypothetical protein